jgi:hypothetical protein
MFHNGAMVYRNRPRGFSHQTTQLKLSEKDIQDQILQWLALQRGFFGWRQNAGMTINRYTNKAGQTSTHAFRASSMSGISDIIGSWYGKPLAIEVKANSGKLRDNQKEFLARAEAAGWICIVAYGLNDVMERLKLEAKQ